MTRTNATSFFLLLTLGTALPACADSQVNVRAGAVSQATRGNDVESEILIGAARTAGAGDLNLNVQVGNVTANAQGHGNRSTIQIGSVSGKHGGKFEATVVIGGEVVLDANGNDAAIRIGSRKTD